jgi:hypothetical protein
VHEGGLGMYLYDHIDYNYLHDKIQDSGYRIKDLEIILGISPVTFYSYRYGLNDIPARHLKILTEKLNLDLKILLKLR